MEGNTFQQKTSEMFCRQKSLSVDDGLEEELPRLQSNPTEMLARISPLKTQALSDARRSSNYNLAGIAI